MRRQGEARHGAGISTTVKAITLCALSPVTGIGRNRADFTCAMVPVPCRWPRFD
jgi:hypothetical protein